MIFSEQNVRLSVIIPTYNRASFVRNCLKSLETCGIANFEVIVVDDGSTDDTKHEVVASPLKPRYLRQKNSGPAVARNHGFELSRGEYVAFLDCDDEWLPGVAIAAIAFLDRHPEVDVLFADAKMGNPDVGFVSWIEVAGQQAFHELPQREIEPGYRVLDRGPFFRRMAERNAVFLGSTILRRKAFVKVGGFDTDLCGAADWNLWLQLAATATFAFTNETLAIYTRHDDGMSNDHDGMSREFCVALRRLLKQVLLTVEQRSWIQARLRHHLFGYAYRAFDRDDYHEARKRFGDLLWLSGWEIRGLVYWLWCWMPFGLGRRFRHWKQKITRNSTNRIVEQPLRNRAVFVGDRENGS